MLRSPIAVYFSLTPNVVSAPRPLQRKLRYPKALLSHILDLTLLPHSRRNNNITPRDRQRTCNPCTSLKRKCTIMWKRVTQATRPAERFSFIPPGFILVARSPKKTEESTAHGEVEYGRREPPPKTRWQLLKRTFSFKG
jgi:hypothetical protein